MKIAFLLTTGDANAGTERAIYPQIQNLIQQGHQVQVLSIYRNDASLSRRLDQSVIITYLVDQPTSSDLTGVFDEMKSKQLSSSPSNIIHHRWDDQYSALTDRLLRPALESLEADIVMALTPALAYAACLFTTTTTQVIAQEHRSSRQRGLGLEPLEIVADELAAVVALNSEDQQWLKDRLYAANPQIWAIPNSLSQIFRPTSSLDTRYIVAAGRLARAKQYDHLVKAYAMVAEHNPGWNLRIYGSGPDRRRLLKLVDSLMLGERVELLPFVENLTLEWPKASIHAMTSRSEGQSLVLMEASAAGVPTVSYDCPTGPRNLISHGHDGFLVQLNNISEMAASLNRLMTDEKLRHELGHNAKLSIQKYRQETVSVLWNEHLDELRENAVGLDRTHINATRRRSDKQTSRIASEGEATGSVASTVPQLYLEDSALYTDMIATDNRKILLEFLKELRVSHRAVEGYSHYRSVFAVPHASKTTVLEGLNKLKVQALAVRALRGNTTVSLFDWYPADQRSRLTASPDQFDVLRIFRHIQNHSESKTIAAVASVDIEFWTESDEGGYEPPRNNRALDKIHDFVEKPSPLPLWDSIDFPIDAVYTWVDDTDPVWRQSKEKFSGESTTTNLSTGSMRFRNRDELKHSLRSIREYAPWIRKIFIVTDSQRVSWLRNDSDVIVVDHRDLFPDTSVLPVFNSHAIESVLHRIEGLAEHFLYFNDDTLLMRLQNPRTYFEGNGQAKFFLSPVKIAESSVDAQPHMLAALNNQELIGKFFGKRITQSMLHTPYPHIRSVIYELEERVPEIFSRVRSNKFRHSSDVSLLSSFAQHYGYFTHRYIPGSIRYTYCSLGLESTADRLSSLVHEENFDVLTVGETTEPEISEDETDFLLKNFFATKFPVKSKDEK